MKTSLSWLQTHIDLSSHSVDQLRDLLTFAGIEVEGIEQGGVESDLIVVAQITSFTQHPNADKLSVCLVDDGTPEPRQIVCGAKNFKAGDKVPLALPGAVLPGGMEIKAGKLRDVVSNGMLCSAKELGLGEDQGGLWILDAETPVGVPLKTLVSSDVIFDLEITPNRPDLLSHRGLARELAALTGSTLKAAREGTPPATRNAEASEIQLSAPESGPFYSARVIKGVKVGLSPEWLRQRLETIGLRPVNNIVDITNFVLHEVGQPLHAFDADKLQGGINVRLATADEKILALDGNEHTLEATDLVIADATQPVAIAGVMGGELSSVTEGTTNILLEAAWFNPSDIRRTARKLALGSDSSYRFERGVDAQRVLHASALATDLILELAGGTAEERVSTAGTPPVQVQDVVFDEARALALIGVPDLKREEIHRILSSLGLAKKAETDSTSTWIIPSYRLDLLRSVDLVEEVARVIGLDRVPSRASAALTSSQSTDRSYDFAMTLRQSLVQRGFFEAQTLRLVSSDQVSDALGARPGAGAVQIKNPLNEELNVLRSSLVPGLLSTAALNIRQGQSRLRFFEVGRVFLQNPNGSSREEERLAILMSGPLQNADWHLKETAAAQIHHLRGLLEVLPGIAGAGLEIVPKPLDGWLLTAEVKRGSKSLGWIGQVAPTRARELDARHPIYVAELALSALQQGAAGPVKFVDLPRFPSISRDVAFELPVDFPNAKVAAFFTSRKESLLIGAELFDVFVDPAGQKLAADKKSVAWSLTYRAPERTLESKEVDAVHQRVLEALVGTLPATLRQ